MFRSVAITGLLALAGCVSDSDGRSDCPAKSYSALLGQNIASVTLPADLYHRIILPDSAISMDYQPDRMNVGVDESGVIYDVSCG